MNEATNETNCWTSVTVYRFENGLIDAMGEWYEQDDLIPDHPALPMVADWLNNHFDEDKLAALEVASEGLSLWIDGLRDNGTSVDIQDALRLETLQGIVEELRDILRTPVPDVADSEESDVGNEHNST